MNDLQEELGIYIEAVISIMNKINEEEYLVAAYQLGALRVKLQFFLDEIDEAEEEIQENVISMKEKK